MDGTRTDRTQKGHRGRKNEIVVYGGGQGEGRKEDEVWDKTWATGHGRQRGDGW